MTDDERDHYRARYERAMHAVQSGVAYEITRGSTDTSPKHLRVGINSAMVNDAALVKLLVAKGIITDDEYLMAVTEEAEAEKARYEARHAPFKFG